jgi:hypothetical protein
VLRARRDVVLFALPQMAKTAKGRRSLARIAADASDDPSLTVDEALFEQLRQLRRRLAHEKAVPPYVIFNDRTLAELAARKPKTPEEFRACKGVGDKKAAELGPLFLAAIAEHAMNDWTVERPRARPRGLLVPMLFVGLFAACRGAEPRPEAAPADRAAATGATADDGSAPAFQPATNSWLGRLYELDPATKRDTWRLVPHEEMFVAWHYTTDPNQASSGDPSQDVHANEVEFQLSFKTKAWQGVFDDRIDLWLGYTQESHDQILQSSVPFRTTDYTPEAFLTGRVDVEAGPLQWRTLSFGFIHQSNGEADDVSRTWNRVFAEFGFERGPFDLIVRPWYRVPEPDGIDDNPDISKFMGPGDVVSALRARRLDRPGDGAQQLQPRREPRRLRALGLGALGPERPLEDLRPLVLRLRRDADRLRPPPADLRDRARVHRLELSAPSRSARPGASARERFRRSGRWFPRRPACRACPGG